MYPSASIRTSASSMLAIRQPACVAPSSSHTPSGRSCHEIRARLRVLWRITPVSLSSSSLAREAAGAGGVADGSDCAG